MKKRSWIVPLLSEFFPANAGLLGLNIGGGGGRTKEIKVCCNCIALVLMPITINPANMRPNKYACPIMLSGATEAVS